MTTYKVTGPLSYMGHPPGETFTADIEEAQERRAIARGALRVVKRDDDKKTDHERSKSDA